MDNLMDVHYRLNIALIEHSYFKLNADEKKKAVCFELKKYVINKIKEINNNVTVNNEAELISLVEVLSTMVDINNYQTITQLTHFIIGLMETIQNHSIIWYINEDEELPTLEISNGTIDKLSTNKDDNPVGVFKFIYNYYINEFDNKKLIKR
ncbi:MAG: hypothetical protein IJ572_00350 [Bacilli bacterium]|nr:hypothetical protein [Bacilli bacterium]